MWWPFRRKVNINPRSIQAKYDAAQTTHDNARHWRMADAFSADTANSSDVRQTLRIRSRYETANNSYAKGIIQTLANDCVGTGPRLQLLTDNSNLNRKVESAFQQWALAVDLARKLRTMRMAKATDGEVFAVLVANKNLASPIKLDVNLVEADRVTAPFKEFFNNNLVDGVQFDRFGNPVSYYILRDHPGDTLGALSKHDRIAAESVIHWFNADRPGQHRGIPEITPALPLFAQLRRFTLAVISAAETAADFAAVLFTDAPANGEATAITPMDVIELEKRMATVLPDGWKLGQIKAEQPCTGYAEFKREILNEIARCLNLPYNIAACNSSGYNYASGRLDHQTYYKSIRVEQHSLATAVLDRIFQAWQAEARLVLGISGQLPEVFVPHQWFFDGTEHVDPAKEANAQQIRLESNTTTLAAEFARQGKDWETELRQRGKERQLCAELGLTTSTILTTTSQPKETDDDNT